MGSVKSVGWKSVATPHWPFARLAPCTSTRLSRRGVSPNVLLPSLVPMVTGHTNQFGLDLALARSVGWEAR